MPLLRHDDAPPGLPRPYHAAITPAANRAGPGGSRWGNGGPGGPGWGRIGGTFQLVSLVVFVVNNNIVVSIPSQWSL